MMPVGLNATMSNQLDSVTLTLPGLTKAIAEGLNIDHVPTPNGRGARWHHSQVARLLRSEVYGGRWQFGKTGITVDFPPIVSSDQWTAAQAAPVGTRSRGAPTYSST